MQRNSVKIEICTPLLSRWGFFYMNMWIPASKSALPAKRRSKWCDLCFSISMDLLRIKSVENHLRFGKSRATPFTSDAWHVEKHGRIVMKMRQSKESWNPNQPGFYGMQLMWTPVPHLWQRPGPTSVQCWHSWNRHSSNSQWSQVYQNCSGGGFGPVSPSLPLGLRVIPVSAWLSGWNRFVLCCLISTCCLSSLWSILLCSIPSSTWFHLTGSSLSHWCGSIPQQPHGGIDSFGCHNAMGLMGHLVIQMVVMIRLTAKNWVQRFIKCWHLVITLMFLISYHSNLQESSCGPERCWMWCQCRSWRTTRCALPVKMERSFGQESWTCMTNYENW